MTRPIPAIVEPTAQELIGMIAALHPAERERVLRSAGIDPGPRSRTSIGRDFGVPQTFYADHIVASWPAEVVRSHRVYFIQAGARDAKGFADVKIGFTTDLDQRLRQLQTASPAKLTVLERVIGTSIIEAYFHRLLDWAHIRGEWFRLRRDDISDALACLFDDGLSWW